MAELKAGFHWDETIAVRNPDLFGFIDACLLDSGLRRSDDEFSLSLIRQNPGVRGRGMFLAPSFRRIPDCMDAGGRAPRVGPMEGTHGAVAEESRCNGREAGMERQA